MAWPPSSAHHEDRGFRGGVFTVAAREYGVELRDLHGHIVRGRSLLHRAHVTLGTRTRAKAPQRAQNGFAHELARLVARGEARTARLRLEDAAVRRRRQQHRRHRGEIWGCAPAALQRCWRQDISAHRLPASGRPNNHRTPVPLTRLLGKTHSHAMCIGYCFDPGPVPAQSSLLLNLFPAFHIAPPPLSCLGATTNASKSSRLQPLAATLAKWRTEMSYT